MHTARLRFTRTQVATWQARLVLDTAWLRALLTSAGFAGFLMLMGVVSFPLPWTPVPFSMMPFGLLVAGACQRPGWAALSVVVYLLAAAAGAPVFAEGESGWRHLAGPTVGYLLGYIAVAALVSWYIQAPRRLLPGRLAWGVLGLVGLAAAGGVFAIVRFLATDEGLATYDAELSGWGVGRSVLWVLLYVIVAATALTLWTLRRGRDAARPAPAAAATDGRPQAMSAPQHGQSEAPVGAKRHAPGAARRPGSLDGTRSLNLFLLFLGATALLHACGVAGLIALGGLSPVAAIVLGSVVFLPFDIIKAGLAVGVSLPFLPTETPHA